MDSAHIEKRNFQRRALLTEEEIYRKIDGINNITSVLAKELVNFNDSLKKSVFKRERPLLRSIENNVNVYVGTLNTITCLSELKSYEVGKRTFQKRVP